MPSLSLVGQSLWVFLAHPVKHAEDIRPMALTLFALAKPVNPVGSDPASTWCLIRERAVPGCGNPLTGRVTHCPPCVSSTATWGLYDTSLMRAQDTFVRAMSGQCPAAISNRNDEKFPFLAHCSSPSTSCWDAKRNLNYLLYLPPGAPLGRGGLF